MRLILTACMFIGLIIGAAGNWGDWIEIIGSSSEPPRVPDIEIFHSDSTGVTIQTMLYGFMHYDTTIDSKNFQQINIPDGHLINSIDDTTIIGQPQIPYIRLLVAVPDSATMTYSVHTSGYSLFKDILLYPIPRIEFEMDTLTGAIGSKEMYAFDTTFYQNTDTLCPGELYKVVGDVHWRDQRVIEIHLYPWQYAPKQKVAYLYHGLDLEITYSGTVVENTHGLGPFEDIGRDILINYPGVSLQSLSNNDAEVHYYTKLDTVNIADYIIVTHSNFLGDATDSAYIDTFAQWRVDHNKFDVGIAKMVNVYDCFLPESSTDSAKALRDFLVFAYDNWRAPSMTDSHFAYCLFVGDFEYVPIETCFVAYPNCIVPGTNTNVWLNAYEGYFRDIDSTYIPSSNSLSDIMLGRWPVDSTEVPAIVQKTISFEKNPVVTEWRRRGLMISGGDNQYPQNEEKFRYFANEGIFYLHDIDYDTCPVRYYYDSLIYEQKIDSFLEMGQIISAYYDHSGPSGWPGKYGGYRVDNIVQHSEHNPATLTNADSQGIVLSYSCNAAMFQREHTYYDTIDNPYWNFDTCFGEGFLYNPSGGAIAFYGGTSPTIIGSYHSEAVRRMLQAQDWIVGKMLINVDGNKKDHCFCLLGDPALDLGDYTAYPDLPDLVIRPQGLDITFPYPGPYYAGGDTIPIEALIWNIGGDTAFSVTVDFDVVTEEDDTILSKSVVIDTLLPRDTSWLAVEWPTDSTHSSFYGEIGDCEFCVNADPQDVIEESWDYNNWSSRTKKIALYPYESGWPKLMNSSSIGQPAIGNLDESGAVEIVCSCADSIYVLNYQGNVFPGWPKYMNGVSGVVLADIDCMGDLEIIATSLDSIKVFDYQGNTVTGWPQVIPHKDTFNIKGLPSVGYVAGTDQRQIVCYTYDNIAGGGNDAIPTKVALAVYDYDGDSLYYFTHDSMYAYPHQQKGICINDVNNDGEVEIIVSYEFFEVEGFPPETTDMCFTDIFNKDGHVRTLLFGNSRSIPALADLDIISNGIPEIIVADKFDTIRAYKEQNQTTLWAKSTEGPIMLSPAAGEIKASATGTETAFGNDSARIWALDRGGYEWQPFPFPVQQAVQTSPALAKISGMFDLEADIIIGSNAQYIYAYEHDGDTITPYPLPLFGTSWTAPVIGDIDGDHKSETVIATNDGYLHVWENLNSTLVSYTLEWPQYHHDYQRTGLYNWTGGFGGEGDSKEFSTFTQFTITIRDTCYMQVNIYNNDGMLVKNLVDQILLPGKHHPVWYGKDDDYKLLPNGVYYVEFKARGEQKIIPVKISR